MNILFMTRVLPVHAPGGMQQHAAALIDLLGGMHRVDVVTTRHPLGREMERSGSVTYHYLKRTMPGRYWGGWWKQSALKARELMKACAYDVIVSESAAAFGYYRYRVNEEIPVPVVTFVHGTMAKELKTTFRKKISLKMAAGTLHKLWLKHSVDGPFYRRVDGIAAVSGEIRDHYGQNAYENVFLVHNGIDTDLFSESAGAEQRRDSGGNEVLLYVGRIEKEKGLDDLVHALKILGDREVRVRLMIAGSGGYEGELRKLIIKQGLENRVKFLGALPQDEIRRLYCEADVVVFPSHCDEGLPLVLLEAMSCGRIVISSESTGTREIIEHGSDGILYRAGDVQTLVNNIEAVLKNRSKFGHIPENARTKIRKAFSRETMAQGALHALETVVKNHKERTSHDARS